MRRRYFFFDYDGTIAIPRTKTIPASTRQVLVALRDEGHFVALATGRMQCNALQYIDSLGIDNIVADGGYSVTVDGELVWLRPLDLEPARSCLKRLDAAGIPWAVQLGNELRRFSRTPEFDRFSPDYYVPTTLDEGIDPDELGAIYKIYIPCRHEDKEAFIASGILDGVPWASYDSENIFVEPLDKGNGIRKMMEIIGGDVRDVVVFGDGKNDLSMFCDEWTSIAMGNAIDELKARASYVTSACDDDGIMRACKHFGWL